MPLKQLKKITRIGKIYPRKVQRNQRILLDYAGNNANRVFNNVEDLRVYLAVDTREEALEITLESYNNFVPIERVRLRDLNNASTAMEKQFLRLLQTNDIDEITLNMTDYRPKYTLEEILNRIILAFINDEHTGNYYTIRIGNNNYILNDNVRNRIMSLVKNDLILEEQHGSDGVLLQDIQNAEQITIRKIVGKNKYTTPDGAFFKYRNLTNMDFSRYGIFSNQGIWEKSKNSKMNFKSNYDDNCLVYALIKSGKVSSEYIDDVRCCIKGLKVPMNILPKICEKIQMRIRVNNLNYETKWNVYGKQFEHEISLGLIDSHYFLNETTNYTAYAIENYNKIKHLENFNHIYKSRVQNNKVYYKMDKDRCINSFQLVKLLLEHKDTLLHKLTTQERELAHSQFFNSLEEDFSNLNYNVSKCTRFIDKKKLIQRINKQTGKIPVFFDFETNTNEGNHKQYLCCCVFMINDKIYRKKFIGYDCGEQLLEFIPENSLLIAHNATYDYRFIIKLLDEIQEISKGNKIISCNAKFKGKKITIKDSYNLINMKLDDFNKNLELGELMRKEVISHKLYNAENIEKKFIDIYYAMSFLKTDEEKTQFKQNIQDWNLEGEYNTFNCLEYSANYCLKDCEILMKGYNKFSSMVIDSVNMNIDNILTIPSLSHNYFVREGCYDDVNEIGGIPQRFIQKSVVGGRCMTNNNLMILCYDILNDFDAVSLYPSAMSIMGFLKGTPKTLTDKELCYNFLEKQDGYFVEIEITDVGVKRDFSLMSYIDDKNKVRNWTNDMVGKKIFVNKISLEDLIEFQNVKFEILKGYYFNEGRNKGIQKIIKYLFNERLKWKKMENPIEQIYKLIMNSGYGKSIMKEIETENKFFETKEKFNKYLCKNYNYINTFNEYGNGKFKVEKIKPFSEHFNLAHIGSEILSMSKRIMNKVICLAEDLKINITYTDTDSIHIKDYDISILKNAYYNKYNKTLIGKGLGQFHTDFEIHKEKCKNIVSIKSIFLGKKAYIDYLKGESKVTGKIVYEYHVRMKGVNEGALKVYAYENEMKEDLFKLYKELFYGKRIEFDLMKGGCLNFKYDKEYNIKTDPIFIREVGFNGDKIIMKNNEIVKIDKSICRKNGKIINIIKRKNKSK